MAGYSKIYCIGGSGGFQGADGINPIRLQIWVGDASRQWFEPHYIDDSLRPLGQIRSTIPEGPDEQIALLDAAIAFIPVHFKECPTLAVVASQLEQTSMLDFDLGKSKIPVEWEQLREGKLGRHFGHYISVTPPYVESRFWTNRRTFNSL